MKRISWNELSYLDLFGIISGTIGLICNLIGLPSLLITSQKVPVGGTEFWILVFVLVFLLIVYITFIVNIYTRRILYIKNKRNTPYALTVKQREKLESGTLVVTCLAGLTLLYIFATSIFILALANHPEAFKDLTSVRPEATINALMITAMLGFLGYSGCLVVHQIGKLVYSAFDPEYK